MASTTTTTTTTSKQRFPHPGRDSFPRRGRATTSRAEAIFSTANLTPTAQTPETPEILLLMLRRWWRCLNAEHREGFEEVGREGGGREEEREGRTEERGGGGGSLLDGVSLTKNAGKDVRSDHKRKRKVVGLF